MENQSKYIMIERNKFAALVKAHRKCLQILSILTYAHTVKEVQLTFTLEEICELLQMTREEVEAQRQKGYISLVRIIITAICSSSVRDFLGMIWK